MLKKLCFSGLVFITTLTCSAQFDLTISPMLVAPSSGCQLSATETITIVVVNAQSSPYAGTFDISYILDGGTPVVETVTTFLPASGTYIYSFIIKADLSGCGVHTLDFEVDDPTDINDPNDYYSTTVTSDCPAVAGTITFPDTVCAGLNSGNLVVWGFTGNVENWIYSLDGGTTWTWTGNTATTQPYLNIGVEMEWWVLMGSPYGYCPDDSTAIIHIDVVPQTNPGFLPANFDICDNGNGGQLDLTGYVGDILQWETSIDNGTTWTTIANTTDSLDYWNLTDTVMYQVLVQNDICPSAYSLPVTLTLIPGTDAGSIVGELLVCNFENDSSLEVNPVLGDVVDWYMSSDNGTTWISQGVADTIFPYSGLLGYTLFAAVIQEANCPYDTVYHSIVVLPLAITATPTTSIFEGDSIQLNASGGSFFYWFPGTNMDDQNLSNPVVWPEYTTTYYVQITDINGCIDTTSLTITVNPNITAVTIPNLLTPNGDAFNDVLQIPNIDTYPNNELIIFNGYGQVIFQASPYNNDWAATYLNAPVPDGTYYYVLNLNDPLLAPDPYQGVITIIGNE